MNDTDQIAAAEAAHDIGLKAHKNNAYYPGIATDIIKSAIEQATKAAYIQGYNDCDVELNGRTPATASEQGYLLPCPFCGSDNISVEPLVGGFVVDCKDCGGGCGTCHDEQAARDEWNKRKSLREVLKERGIDSDKVTAEIEAKVAAHASERRPHAVEGFEVEVKPQSADTKRLDWLLEFLRTSTFRAIELSSRNLKVQFDFKSLDREAIDDAIDAAMRKP